MASVSYRRWARALTDDGQAGEAVAFDLKTFQTGARIKAQPDADGIAFDPVSGHIFVVDGDSKVLTVIDPKTDTAIATVDAGGKLEYAVSGENGYLYVNGAENKEIIRVNTWRPTRRTRIGRSPIAPARTAWPSTQRRIVFLCPALMR